MQIGAQRVDTEHALSQAPELLVEDRVVEVVATPSAAASRMAFSMVYGVGHWRQFRTCAERSARVRPLDTSALTSSRMERIRYPIPARPRKYCRNRSWQKLYSSLPLCTCTPGRTRR